MMLAIYLVFLYTILTVPLTSCYAENEERIVEVEYGKLFALQLTSQCNKQEVCRRLQVLSDTSNQINICHSSVSKYHIPILSSVLRLLSETEFKPKQAKCFCF